ncbi:hypothetical protein [Microbacterium sp. CJ88]|uniref:hypothetical protein n=1 Tax=Microbacterium sp. CJ88 TaxID=3445672 RepID=UPI003F65CA45
MRRTASLIAAGAAVLIAAVVLAGCAEPPRPQPSATSLPGGIEASIVQLRSDVADRQAQLRIHNTATEPLVIGTVRVDDPRFAGHAVRTIRRQTTIAPGATVDIRIQLPEMNCSADLTGVAPGDGSPQTELTPAATPSATPDATRAPAGPTPGASGPTPAATPTPGPTGGGLPSATTTRATVNYQFGASIAIAVAQLSEPIPFLESMYDHECLGQQVAGIAKVTIGSFTPSAAGQPADLAIDIAPVAATAPTDAAAAPQTATVLGIHQTNLLSFGTVGGAQPAVYPIGAALAPGGAPQTVHLPLLPGRCDAHVIQEDKRGTVFNVDVEIDGQPGIIQLAADPTMRGEILTWASHWCGIS